MGGNNHHFPERLVQFISSEVHVNAYDLYPRVIPFKADLQQVVLIP